MHYNLHPIIGFDFQTKTNPLPLQKVMHTRKRHMELFQELNQKFQTLDRFQDIPNMGSMVSNNTTNRKSAVTGNGEGQREMIGQRSSVVDQLQSWRRSRWGDWSKLVVVDQLE